MADEWALVQKARTGDRGAFEALVAPHTTALRSYIFRMVGHPDDADDIAQDALIAAQQGLAKFRGDARFKTWLFTIATRKTLDVLRKRKRWPVEAQTHGEKQFLESKAATAELERITQSPDYCYDYRQHVAYCFSCVARSLEPEESAALLLKELLLFDSGTASEIMNLSESTYRHRLSAARKTMRESFEGLCALVGKQGVCYQCNSLRQFLPESKQGSPVEPLASDDAPAEEKLVRRLNVVREAPLEQSPVHTLLLRFMGQLWDSGN